MTKMKIEILGTEYELIKDVPEDKMLPDTDGYCDPSEKTIHIVRPKETPEGLKNLAEYENHIMRHEIIHAFLYESGLWGSSHETTAWAINEEMVDWLAIQTPKIYDVFIKAGCLEKHSDLVITRPNSKSYSWWVMRDDFNDR